MINTFGNKETKQIFEGIALKKVDRSIQQKCRLKLRMLNASVDVADLRIPPSNRLEKLKGDLKEFYSIRVNKQWRIIFRWEDNNAYDVELIDYH